MYFLKQFFSFVEVQLTNHKNYSGLYYSLISSKRIQSCSCRYCVIQRTSLTAKGFFISAQSDYDVLYCFSACFLVLGFKFSWICGFTVFMKFGENLTIIKIFFSGSSHHGSVEMNLTSIHEGASPISGLTQWVKDLVLL